MYVGPWHEYRLYQIMMLKQKYKEQPTPKRNPSNDSNTPYQKSAGGSSISITDTSQSKSVFTNNATQILQGVYSQWKEFDTQSSFAKHVMQTK